MRKIGLFGGTFDPVHYGHLAVARSALDKLSFETLYFIPAASPPHKPDQLITPFRHRVVMLQLALRDEPRFVVSEVEGERNGPSYTVDTLVQFQHDLGPDADFFFIIGLDAFADITSWNRYNELLDKTSFVVIDRPFYGCRSVTRVIAEDLPAYRQERERVWCRADGKRIYSLEMEPVDVSSSLVRERLRRGIAVDDMIPEAVLEYLRRNHLPPWGKE